VTIGLVAAAIGAAAFELTKAFSILRIIQKGNASVLCGVWDRLLNVPVSFFRNYTAGDLAMRANGIGEISAQLKGPVTLTALSALFTSFNLALMFYYSPILAVTGAVLIAIALGTVLLLCRSQFATHRRIQSLRGEIGGLILQVILGIGKIRTAGAEIRAFARWALSFEKQVTAQYSARTAEMATSIFSAVYSNLCTMVLFTIVAFYATDQRMSVGAFLAFNSAFGAFLAASLSMGGALVSFISVIFLYERCVPILKAQPEVDEAHQLRAPGRLNGRVEVNQVSFRYDRNGGFVLDGVSLRAAPGEFIAIVGPSGAGKSTLFRLLLGFESPEFGAIYFDGQEQSRLEVGSVRRQMGVVLQNGKLIPGSIFHNIAGPANLGLDDAWRAARLAGIEDDIRAMPMQMHTIIMEGGGGFSGGQKQRLMIARALAGNPRILLFDEATSALDNRTQALVSRSIESLRVTRIVSAHRLSTVINADRIYVLCQGRIVQTGTYAELMAQEGPFKELAARQVI
jgi:ATP-binding cassette subfamily C protein